MKKYEENVGAAVQRLIDGDIYAPIKAVGSPSQRTILHKLETLRLSMLTAEDAVDGLDKKNKTAIASMVHDLKTPLAIISGYAESLKDGMDDKDYAALIYDKTSQMNDTVLSLVDASKQELTASSPRMEKVSARTYLLGEIKKFEPLALTKNIKLKQEKAPNVNLRVNKVEIARVLQNVISNALKYTSDNGKIKISFAIGSSMLSIIIKDNGVGIDKKSLPLVFEKFYREDSARTTSNSGLGLYIAKEILNEHGGTISVHSKKGKGSTFTIKLPIEPEVGKTLIFTQRFDKMKRLPKFLSMFFGGWFLSSFYRIMKFRETYCVYTLVAGICALPLFMFAWPLDLISVLASNKISYLAD